MSVFQVKLNNGVQGQMDVDMVTGRPVAVSNQKTVYIAGPNLTVRARLKDGDVFTDSNYYKRFCYPQAAPDDAFLVCLTDDGSVWQGFNYQQSLQNNFPRYYVLTIAGGTTFTATANTANITADTGGTAVYAQISNTGSNAVKVRLNGLATSIIDLPAGTTQIFENGELRLNKIEVDATASGTGASTVKILVSVLSPNLS